MPLQQHRDRRFTLPELVQAASELLARAPKPQDARVNPLPDARTVRYYQSTQLLDRPLGYEGRRAIYGYRHLLQLCAVKLLQGAGRGLDEIQQGLSGRSDAQLEASLLPALAEPVSSPMPQSVPKPRALISAELGPGVVVTIDPDLVSKPQALLDRLTQALTPEPR